MRRRALRGPTVQWQTPPASRSHWSIDILVDYDADVVAIDYDGVYWHRDRHSVDHRKTRDLLDAGYRVVRFREHGLSPLDITDDRFLQLTVPVTLAASVRRHVSTTRRPAAPTMLPCATDQQRRAGHIGSKRARSALRTCRRG